MMHMKWYLHEPTHKRNNHNVEHWMPRLPPNEAIKEHARGLVTLSEVYVVRPEPTAKRLMTEEHYAARILCDNPRSSPEVDAECSGTQRSSADEWATSSQDEASLDDVVSEHSSKKQDAPDGAAAMLLALATQCSAPACSESASSAPPLATCASIENLTSSCAGQKSSTGRSKLKKRKAIRWCPQWQPRAAPSAPEDAIQEQPAVSPAGVHPPASVPVALAMPPPVAAAATKPLTPYVSLPWPRPEAISAPLPAPIPALIPAPPTPPPAMPMATPQLHPAPPKPSSSRAPTATSTLKIHQMNPSKPRQQISSKSKKEEKSESCFKWKSLKYSSVPM